MEHKQSVTSLVKEIKRRTRRTFSTEEKIKIVLEGLRGEESVKEICRRYGIHENNYYNWSKDLNHSILQYCLRYFPLLQKKCLLHITPRYTLPCNIRQLHCLYLFLNLRQTKFERKPHLYPPHWGGRNNKMQEYI